MRNKIRTAGRRAPNLVGSERARICASLVLALAGSSGCGGKESTEALRGSVFVESLGAISPGKEVPEIIASAYFAKPWPPSSSAGGCQRMSAPNAPSLDAGDITFAFAGTLGMRTARWQPESRRYELLEMRAGAARPEGVDAPTTISGSGGANHPAFSGVVRSPWPAPVTASPMTLDALGEGDLTLTWQETRNDRMVFRLQSKATAGAVVVACETPAADRTLTVPRNLVALARSDDANRLYVDAVAWRATVVPVGDGAVDLEMGEAWMLTIGRSGP